MNSLKDDIRGFYRNLLRLTAKENDSHNLLVSVNSNIYRVVYGDNPRNHVFKGIETFCCSERPGTVIMDWSPLKTYLSQADTELARDYLKRITELEEKRSGACYSGGHQQ